MTQGELAAVGEVAEGGPSDADVLNPVVGNLAPIRIGSGCLVVVARTPVAEGRRLEGLDPTGTHAPA